MDAVITLGPRKPPPAAAFIAPEGIPDDSFLGILLSVAGDVVSSFSDLVDRRRDARFLVRRIRLLLSLFEAISDSRRPLSRLAALCLKEFYIVLHRARVLLNYIAQGSRLWLLLREARIAEQFQELDREISTLLDVIPFDEFHLVADVREHVDLLRRQVAASSRRGLFIDSRNRDLKIQILSFFNEFERGETPDADELKHTFVDLMGISGAKGFEWEIESLENEISNREDDEETDWRIISGVSALIRYCRFLLFGLRGNEGKKKTSPATNSVSIPKDFCCPISLELMRDPVVVSTVVQCWQSNLSQLWPVPE
ncbi:hypothetical protein HPP92_024059 [Vanilla planifolia]|uniref:U-box domain-containing protein n=1 Tax=Vanilla planifolia TaxID=51239 RepID=A0A835PRB2_VANPL|nr:hypothetical protein HPP92_024059 [Vanilla planifolia]